MPSFRLKLYTPLIQVEYTNRPVSVRNQNLLLIEKLQPIGLLLFLSNIKYPHVLDATIPHFNNLNGFFLSDIPHHERAYFLIAGQEVA